MTTARVCLTVLLGVFAAATARSGDVPFQHPGILTSQAELDAIQKHVAAQDPGDVNFAGYVSTMKTRFADADFVPQPMARPQRIDNKKDTDPPALQRDSAMTAYTLALKWVVTGDATARAKAISIMDAWSKVFDANQGDENRFLDSSWVVTVWCAAGELIRHGTYHGERANWPPADVARFGEMIRRLEVVSSQIIVRPFNPGSNWGTSSMLGDMAAGVFLDDHAMYARGRDALLKYLPDIIKKEGYCKEVFRDPWHGIVALTGAIQAAEVGRHQGDLSIYHAKFDGQPDPRLLVAVRWYANPLRGIPVPLPPMGGPQWKPVPWSFNAADGSHDTGGFEIALNFYGWIEPSANLQDFRDAVLKTYRPSYQNRGLFIESDTLTHGDLYRPDQRITVEAARMP